MTKLRVECCAVSVDGYAAGYRQDLQSPLGVQAGLIDTVHLAVRPVLMGTGERAGVPS